MGDIIVIEPAYKALDRLLQQAKADFKTTPTYYTALRIQKYKRQINNLISDNRKLFTVIEGDKDYLDTLWNEEMRFEC